MVGRMPPWQHVPLPDDVACVPVCLFSTTLPRSGPHLAPLVCCKLLHAVSFIDCHMNYMVLRLFEADLGSSVSTIIVSKVAVACFFRACYYVLVCVKKERHGKQMLRTTKK